MNLFIQEFKMSVKSLITWCSGVMIFLGIIATKSTGITGDSSSDMTNIISNMPKSLQTIFGLGEVDLSKTIGIFAITLLYISLILAFHASSLGNLCFSREERDKTFEFLYVKGMSRFSILGVKILVSLIQILILNILTYIFSVIIIRITLSENIAKDFLPMMMGVFFIQLIFFSIGLLLSFLLKDSKKSGSLSFAVVIVCFLFTMFSDISEKAHVLRYITPFKYFDGKEILSNGLNFIYIGICIILSILFISYSCILHNKRDLSY